MIYEQNGKTIMLLKSSLTAFEGEVDYVFGKDAYKTPEEFKQLAIELFNKRCSIVINGDEVKLSNVQIQLGHETNLFSELVNVPKKVNSLNIKSAMFKDMPNNQCEIILNINGYPLKQYILNNSNQQEVAFKIENNKVVEYNATKHFYFNAYFIASLIAFLAVSIFLIIRKKSSLRIINNKK